MSKDPAILFYTSDFLTGTMFLSDEQTGQYIRLLCAQHQKGRLYKKDMLNICKTYDQDIFDKFKIDKNGLYYNERLEKEAIRRKKYSESRSQNRKKKAITEKTSLTYEKHMETETETETINKVKNEYRKFKHLSISKIEIEKLKEKGYSIESINNVLDSIENFKNNKKYNSLYLTSLNWLKKENTKINDYDI